MTMERATLRKRLLLLMSLAVASVSLAACSTASSDTVLYAGQHAEITSAGNNLPCAGNADDERKAKDVWDTHNSERLQQLAMSLILDGGTVLMSGDTVEAVENDDTLVKVTIEGPQPFGVTVSGLECWMPSNRKELLGDVQG